MALILAFKEGGNFANPPIVDAYREAPMTAVHVKNRAAQAKRDRWLRMQAVQVVTMLPDDAEEAQRVLSYARGILSNFIEETDPALSLVKRD